MAKRFICIMHDTVCKFYFSRSQIFIMCGLILLNIEIIYEPGKFSHNLVH